MQYDRCQGWSNCWTVSTCSDAKDISVLSALLKYVIMGDTKLDVWCICNYTYVTTLLLHDSKDEGASVTYRVVYLANIHNT